MYTAGQPVLCLSIVSYSDGVHASLISIAHLLCTCMSWGGGGGHHTLIRPHTTKHHLQQILLYSLQHQLPTRSVLHHHDHSHLPHKVELHWSGKERRNKGITDAHKKREQFESEYEEEK